MTRESKYWYGTDEFPAAPVPQAAKTRPKIVRWWRTRANDDAGLKAQLDEFADMLDAQAAQADKP
jgi:hypothetical protein